MGKMFTRTYSDYLYKNKKGDVWLKRPSSKQFDELKQISIQLASKNEDNIISKSDSIILIKYIYQKFTSQSQEVKSMTVEEFTKAFNEVVFEKKIREAVTLYKRVGELLSDVADEIHEDAEANLEIIRALSKTIDSQLSKNEISSEFVDILKKHNINVDPEAYVKLIQQQAELQKEKDNKNKDIIRS